jgi:hypothetical protein
MNNGRFLLAGTVVAGITLFVWQTISNAALPWHMATMREFANNDVVVQMVRANAPENGVYVSNQGILAAVSLTPTLIDKTTLIGQMLGKQVASRRFVSAVRSPQSAVVARPYPFTTRFTRPPARSLELGPDTRLSSATSSASTTEG